jgi:cytochrome c oxidase assembly protein subunit 15
MALAVMIQVVLGVASWWMLRPFDGIPRTVTIIQAMVRTGHQANGALLLAASVILTFRAFRHLAPATPAPGPGHSNPSALDLEAVA